MPDLLDLLKKETPSEIKLLKVERKLADYSNAYQKVIFEQRAPCKNNNLCNDKSVFNFKESLDNLIQRGYSRHPRPNETFSLLCAYLEDDSSVKSIAKIMLSGYGEWFSLAMKCQNNLLYCYIDPELEFDNPYSQYALKSCTSELHFAFPSSDKNWISIQEVNNLNPELVEFLWSRPFDKLPLNIRNNAYLWVYKNLWPAGRGGSRYGVDCCGYDDRASRGVVLK